MNFFVSENLTMLVQTVWHISSIVSFIKKKNEENDQRSGKSVNHNLNIIFTKFTNQNQKTVMT